MASVSRTHLIPTCEEASFISNCDTSRHSTKSQYRSLSLEISLASRTVSSLPFSQSRGQQGSWRVQEAGLQRLGFDIVDAESVSTSVFCKTQVQKLSRELQVDGTLSF